jgi:type IV pilus biogenesis protein PilP
MSKLQAKKLEDDFLLRLGYTSVVPARAMTQRAATPKPTTQLVALGIYGPGNALQADVAWAGRVMPVKPGQKLADGVTVQKIESGVVVLSIQRGKGDKASARQVSVATGEAVELEN